MNVHCNDPKVKQVMEVYRSLWRINKIAAKLTKKSAEDLGLSLQQLLILNTLFAFPELTQQELADRLVSSKSTISVGVDKLVKMGLVKRNVFKADRRVVKLNLTNQGEEVSRKFNKNSSPFKAMLYALDKMPDEDIRSLLRIQKKLFNHLNESGF